MQPLNNKAWIMSYMLSYRFICAIHSSTSSLEVSGSVLSLTLRPSSRADRARRGSISGVMANALLVLAACDVPSPIRWAALGYNVPNCYQRNMQ